MVILLKSRDDMITLRAQMESKQLCRMMMDNQCWTGMLSSQLQIEMENSITNCAIHPGHTQTRPRRITANCPLRRKRGKPTQAACCRSRSCGGKCDRCYAQPSHHNSKVVRGSETNMNFGTAVMTDLQGCLLSIYLVDVLEQLKKKNIGIDENGKKRKKKKP